MSSDWDWLEYLSMLNPRCSLSGLDGRGGVPRVARDDVLAALSSCSPLAMGLAYARCQMGDTEGLVERTSVSAFVAALSVWRTEMTDFTHGDFAIVWRLACRECAQGGVCRHCSGSGKLGIGACPHCAGSGHVDATDNANARAAGVSRDKWARLKPMHPLCKSLIAEKLDEVRRELKRHLRVREVA